jgi:hypothetical protein
VAQALARHGIQANLVPKESFFIKPLTAALEEALSTGKTNPRSQG